MDPLQLQQIHEARARVSDAARPGDVDLLRSLGKLTAHERIDAIIDQGSLVEYGPLAGETPSVEDDAHADGLVGGVGRIDGDPVVIASYDVTVRGGTQTERNMRKLARLLSLANRHRWPFVCFVDGGGARTGLPANPPPVVVYSRATWDVYEGLAELSGWAPSIAVVSGDTVDGNAGIAMLCDCVIATRGSFLASRLDDGELVRQAVEELAAEGHVDLLVDDEQQACATVVDYLAYWGDGFGAGQASPNHGSMASLIPDERRQAYDVRLVMDALVDDQTILELGADWGTSIVTAFATLGGRPIGIFANQPISPVAGAIDAAAADKAARFIELCDAYELPLVSLVDNPGYMVGPQAERQGIARHHARPLAALHHRTVALCSVQLRKAYGLGPYAMSGWGASRVMPELKLAWPSVESGGMSLEGAAFLVKRKEIKAAATAEEARTIRDTYAEEMREPASGVSAARTFSFDDVVDPADTRGRIIAMLDNIPRVFAEVKKHPIELR